MSRGLGDVYKRQVGIQESNLPLTQHIDLRCNSLESGRWSFFITMRFKAKVYIRLRESVSDAAGNAIMANVNKVAKDIKVDRLRINKMIELNFEVENEEKAREQLDILSDRMFANIVIEDWEYDLDVVD